MKPFEELLQEAVAYHGHLCPGQVIGVRMAVFGCRLLRIDEPRSKTWAKRLITFVEIDRCATDAISSVTGCRLGSRTLKFKDYGIMAATFLRLDSNEAYRVVAREDAREEAARLFPGDRGSFDQQLKAYPILDDDHLFSVERVDVELPLWQMPGRPLRHARCAECGQVVRDGRELRNGGSFLCAPCSGGAYFSPTGRAKKR